MPHNHVNPAHRKPMTCPHCYSKKIVRYGTLTLKHQKVQRFRCKACKKTFTDKDTKHRTYPLKTILAALTTYNRGNTLDRTSRQTAKRFSTRIPKSTLHNWIQDYQHICTFTNLRRTTVFREKPLLTRRLYHTQLYYYQYHRAKLGLIAHNLPRKSRLENYLLEVPTRRFPHSLFTPKAPRMSQVRFPLLNTRAKKTSNNASALASLALEFANTNSERHQAIQDFFIANDAHTIAAEVPVYLTPNDLRYYSKHPFTLDLPPKHTITGHIDLLQIRNRKILILDYKPDARNQKPLHQLTAYALALASRLRLPLKQFTCAWFDDRDYYEFFPLKACYARASTTG